MWPGYVAPTDVSPPPWIFPNGLNRTFITEYNALNLGSLYYVGNLPDGDSAFQWGYDIISAAAWNLSDYERIDVSPEVETEPLPFGYEDNVVMMGDHIQPSWSGGEEKVVSMACRYCKPNKDGGVYQNNKKCG